MTYKKMNKTTKKQWLKALRSDEYKQCGGVLCEEFEEGPRFCCLGVLYDVTQDAYWKECKIKGQSWRMVWSAHRPNSSFEWDKGYYGNEIIGDLAVDALSSMNDSGKSFKQIANWIEKNL